MPNISELDVLAAFAAVVEAYPAPAINQAGYKSEMQPNTFLAVYYPSYLMNNTSTYGKTERHSNQSYYFNRLPQNEKSKTVSYPAVSLFASKGTIDPQSGLEILEYQLLIEANAPVSVGQNNAGVGQGLRLQTEEEIHNAIRNMGNAIFNELKHFVLATITPIPPQIPATYTQWISEKYLEAEATAGNLTYTFSERFENVINQNISISREIMDLKTTQQTIGQVFTFSVFLDTCPVVGSFNYKPFDKNRQTPQNCC